MVILHYFLNFINWILKIYPTSSLHKNYLHSLLLSLQAPHLFMITFQHYKLIIFLYYLPAGILNRFGRTWYIIIGTNAFPKLCKIWHVPKANKNHNFICKKYYSIIILNIFIYLPGRINASNYLSFHYSKNFSANKSIFFDITK